MIIGLGYKKRVGKDTVGDILAEHYRFLKISFATPLKELADLLQKVPDIGIDSYLCQLNAWTDRYDLDTASDVYQTLAEPNRLLSLYGESEDGKPRKLLQYLGTELIRDRYDKEFWILCAQREIDKNKGTPIVITDVRFPNEKTFIERLGVSVCILRSTGLTDTHASECSLDTVKWDYYIDNSGTMSQLEDQVYNLLEYIVTKEV